MTTLRTLQPAQTTDADAEFDPMLPMPYPWHIEGDGSVDRQDFWKGCPARLIGFQEGDEHRVVLRTEDWFKGPADAAVGLKPVFVDVGGDMWADGRPVSEVKDWTVAE